MDQNFTGGSGGRLRHLLGRHFRSGRVQDVSETNVDGAADETTPPTPTSLSTNAIANKIAENVDEITQTIVKVDSESKTLITLKGVKFALTDDNERSEQSLNSADQNENKLEQRSQTDQNESFDVFDDGKLKKSSVRNENILKISFSEDANFSDNRSTRELTTIEEHLSKEQKKVFDHQKVISNGEGRTNSTAIESIASGFGQQLSYNEPIVATDSESISTSSGSRQSTAMQQKTLSLKSNRVSPAPSESESKTSSTKSRSDSRRRQDDQLKSETLPATIVEEDANVPAMQTKVVADAMDATEVKKAIAATSSTHKDAPPTKKASKEVAKRKASLQHRNSKQETALLLRRKSLTPSTKLILLCKKGKPFDEEHLLFGQFKINYFIKLCNFYRKTGDWLAVETFLKQADRRTFDFLVVNEETNWTPIMYAAKDNRVSILEKLISLGFDVNAKANDGLTALHVACSNAREDTIKLLLLKRADATVAGGVS